MCVAGQGGPEWSKLLGEAGVSARERIVGMFLYPWFAQWHHTWPEALRSQFGLSDLMAPIRGFKAGQFVQSK